MKLWSSVDSAGLTGSALTGRINVKGMDCAWPGEGILGRE